MMRGMVIDMNDAKLRTLDQVRAFVQGTVALDFCVLPNLTVSTNIGHYMRFFNFFVKDDERIGTL